MNTKIYSEFAKDVESISDSRGITMQNIAVAFPKAKQEIAKILRQQKSIKRN